MGWTVRGSNPGGSEIFRTCPDWPCGPPSLLYNKYRVFSGVKSGRSVTLTPDPLLVPLSWKSRAIPLLPLWAVRPLQSLSACTRVTFTYNFCITLNITRYHLVSIFKIGPKCFYKILQIWRQYLAISPYDVKRNSDKNIWNCSSSSQLVRAFDR